MPPAKKSIQLFINNRFEPAASGQAFSSINPATGDDLADLALAGPDDVDRAVAAARAAFDDGPWPRMRAAERAEYLRAMAEAIDDNQEPLGLLEAMDTGISLAATRAGHVQRAVQAFRYYAAETDRIAGESLPIDDAYLNVTSREPIGVVAIITPWNAPLGLASTGLAAALACGNTCVIKPSELAPVTTAELAKIALALEFPPGVINVVHGPGRPTGEALAGHPAIDAIAFTGSSPTGSRLMELASRGLKRFVGELGGSAPTLVFADAELETTIDATLLSAFANNGQTCVAGSRILVERALYPTFVERFAARARAITFGDPLAAATEVGPVISAAHRQRLIGLIADACDRGARLCCGGGAPDLPGFYLQPTVIADLPATARLAREESLGPIVAIAPFTDEVDAIRRANDSHYGLAAYVWTGHPQRGLRVARQLRAGTVWLNSSMTRDLRAPFGGVKQSGVGRIGGRYSIDAFTEVKNTCIAVRPYPVHRYGVRDGAPHV